MGSGLKVIAFKRVVTSQWCFKINPAEEYSKRMAKMEKARTVR